MLKQAGCQLVGMDTAIALCTAAAKGDLTVIQTLVENGVDPNLADYDGTTTCLSCLACVFCRAEEFDMLVEMFGTHHLMTEARHNYTGRTALHLAASEGMVKVLDYLLTLGAKIDVNPVDITGGTPLDDSIRHQQEVTETMLRRAGGMVQGDPQLDQLKIVQHSAKERHECGIRKPQVQDKVANSKETAFESTFFELMATFDDVDAALDEPGAVEQDCEDEGYASSSDSQEPGLAAKQVTFSHRVLRLERFVAEYCGLVKKRIRALQRGMTPDDMHMRGKSVDLEGITTQTENALKHLVALYAEVCSCFLVCT